MTSAKIVGLTDDDGTRFFVYVGFDHSRGFVWHKWPIVSASTAADARVFCDRNNLSLTTPTLTYSVTGARRYDPNSGVQRLL